MYNFKTSKLVIMKYTIKPISIIAGICLLLSCSNKSQRETSAQLNEEVYAIDALSEEKAPATQSNTSTPINFISSFAATNYDDGIHQFIRTVQMKFRVKSVPEATYTIEDIITKHKGFIIRSAISNENSYSTTTNISKDSSLVTYHSNLIADLKLRIPRTQLDTVLKELAPLALEIDYRTIEANDVTLQLLSEKLKQERLNKKEKRVSTAIDNNGKKLDSVIDAEEVLDNTIDDANKTKLAEYDIKDQIEYSTINIKLYQSTTNYQEKVLREKPTEEYKPSLGEQAIEALHNGWIIISTLFIFLLNIWPIILIAVLAWILYSKYKKRKD